MSPAAPRGRSRGVRSKEERHPAPERKKGPAADDADTARPEPAPAAIARGWAPFASQDCGTATADDWRGMGGPSPPSPLPRARPRPRRHRSRRDDDDDVPPIPPVVTVDRDASFGSAVTAPRAPPPPPSEARLAVSFGMNTSVVLEEPASFPRDAEQRRPCRRSTPRRSRFSPAILECGGMLGYGPVGSVPHGEERQGAVDDRNCCERAADCLISDCGRLARCVANCFRSSRVASWKGDIDELQDLLFGKADDDDAKAAKYEGLHCPGEDLALEEIEVLPLCSAVPSAPRPSAVPARSSNGAPLATLREEMRSAGFREVPV